MHSLLLLPACFAASPYAVNEHDIAGWWHGQVGQDYTIAGLFPNRNGFFVDLAANQPVRLSNTRALERDLGWRGVCIEGNQKLVPFLQAKRRCAIVQALVGKAGFNVSLAGGRGSAGTVAAKTCAPGREGCLPTRPLHDILDEHQAPRTIEYLSLDVEGQEDNVLNSFRFDRYVFLALTVERPKHYATTALRSHGYRYAFNHGHFGDQLWLHESVPGGFDAAFARANASHERWNRAMKDPNWNLRRSARVGASPAFASSLLTTSLPPADFTSLPPCAMCRPEHLWHPRRVGRAWGAARARDGGRLRVAAGITRRRDQGARPRAAVLVQGHVLKIPGTRLYEKGK